MIQKYYFYILECRDSTKYYGSMNSLSNRLNDHLKGRVKSTRNKRPLELLFYKECESRSEAFRLEMKFKNGRTRKTTIKKLLDNFPKEKCQGFNSHSDLHFS
ncbi:GIY-YIG nuclease family protein [Candidatus Omnitrophota bacterium]